MSRSRKRQAFAVGLLAVFLTGLSGLPVGSVLHELDHLLATGHGDGPSPATPAHGHHHHHGGADHSHSPLVLALAGTADGGAPPTALAPVPGGDDGRLPEQDRCTWNGPVRPDGPIALVPRPGGERSTGSGPTPPTPPPIPRAS